MDEQLIKQVAREEGWYHESETDGIYHFDIVSLSEFLERFLDRIDAERGKSAVAWMSPGPIMSEFTKFDYLLNAMMHAAQHERPASQDYKGKREAVKAYIADLEQTIAMLRTGDTCARMCEGTAYRIEAQQLKARCVDLEKDAARYRWLTNHAYVGECYTENGTIFDVQNSDREVPIIGPLDAAIDAAIAEAKP